MKQIVIYLFSLLLVIVGGCTHLNLSMEERNTLVCGRIRLIVNGEKVAWTAIFDRPTPELYHIETQRFINRIELADGLFAEAIERDGTFCWQLATGRYLISRIVPFQGSPPTTLDDRRTFVFPGTAFQVDETMRSVYLGTLRIAVSVRKDFMGNRWMTGKPSIEIVDEFESDRAISRNRHTTELNKQLMVSIPELVDVPFHPVVPDIPAILRAVPWFRLMPHG